MRKSPFSTPRGNGSQRGYKWRSNDRRGGRGYVHHMNNSFDSNYSPNVSQNSTGSDDFIAFDTSSPSYHDKRQSGSSFVTPRGGRNRDFFGSPGFHNDNRSPRVYFDNSPSPYRNDMRQSRGRNNKMFQQRMPRREIHISQYVDLVSFLEDPWKDLMDQNKKSTMNEVNLNDIAIDKSACKIDLNSSFDDSKLLNTSNCSKEIEDENINEKTSFSSNDESNSNNKLSQDSVDNN